MHGSVARLVAALVVDTLLAAAILAVAGCSDPITEQVVLGPHAITGRVLGGFGLAVEGVHLELTGRFGRVTALSGTDGSFVFDRLPEGPAILTATLGADSARLAVDPARIAPNGVVVRLPRWGLAWSDEFDGDRLDPTKWIAWDAPTEQHSERAWFRPDQVSLAGGTLRLRTDAPDDGARWYPSGGVVSRFAQRYGRFEVRARLPRGEGVWSAHWLVNADSVEPFFEIDIMEMLGGEPQRVYFHNHFKSSRGANDNIGSSFSGDDFSDGFHTFRVDWYVRNIVWSVDGIERFRSIEGVPDRAGLIRLNTTVGGWAGEPGDAGSFPVFHDVDYVRVYSLER